MVGGVRLLLISSIFLVYFTCCTQTVLFDANKNVTIFEQTKELNESIGDKLRRLKDLRSQTKALAAELRQSKLDNIISVNESNGSTGLNETGSFGESNGLAGFKSKNHRLKRWKKRIQRRIGQLTKRLAKLERAVISQQTKIEKVLPKIGARSRKLSTKSKTTKPMKSTLPTQLADSEHPKTQSTMQSTTQPKMQSTTQPTIAVSQNKARPGHDQSICTTHNDCSPGHCCHKFDQLSKCIKHALNETSVCRNSCQCESHLHCFRKNDVNGERGQSYCKQAHRNDFVQGIYENSKIGIF